MVKVYAPASSANMSVGFDVLGAAVTPIDGSLLGDNVSVEAADRFSLQKHRLSMLGTLLPGNWQERAGGDDAGKKYADRLGSGFQRLFRGRRAGGDERILR